MSVNPILLSGKSVSVLSSLMRLLLLPGSERVTGKPEANFPIADYSVVKYAFGPSGCSMTSIVD